MTLEQLKQAQESIQEQFNNLSSPQWVAIQLERLKGTYEVYAQMINNIEQEQKNAASSEKQATKRTNRNND